MTADWWTGPFAAFDLETTGVDPFEARIVTAAMYVVETDGTAAGETLLVNPGVPIPEGASSVHGITDEMAATGRPAPGAILAITEWLDDVQGLPVVIFNAPYDWTLLHAECTRHRLPPPPASMLVDPTICDRILDKWRKGSRKLNDLCQYYGVVLELAHEAKSDAIAAAAVMRALVQRYPALHMTLEQLQVRQGVRYDEWRTGINDYWKSRNEAKHIPPGWPIQLWSEAP